MPHKIKIARSVVLTVFGWVEADSLEGAVQEAIDHNEIDWEYLFDTVEPLGYGDDEDAEVYWVEGDDAPDPHTTEPTNARSYAQEHGLAPREAGAGFVSEVYGREHKVEPAAATVEEVASAANDGELPDDLVWDADYAVLTATDGGEHPVPESLWVDALQYDGPGVSDMLVNGDTYHARVSPFDALVGFRFEFAIDDGGRIVADGVCHPATESMSGDYHTDFGSTLDARRVLVLPKSKRTEQLLTAYVGA